MNFLGPDNTHFALLDASDRSHSIPCSNRFSHKIFIAHLLIRRVAIAFSIGKLKYIRGMERAPYLEAIRVCKLVQMRWFMGVLKSALG